MHDLLLIPPFETASLDLAVSKVNHEVLSRNPWSRFLEGGPADLAQDSSIATRKDLAAPNSACQGSEKVWGAAKAWTCASTEAPKVWHRSGEMLDPLWWKSCWGQEQPEDFLRHPLGSAQWGKAHPLWMLTPFKSTRCSGQIFKLQARVLTTKHWKKNCRVSGDGLFSYSWGSWDCGATQPQVEWGRVREVEVEKCHFYNSCVGKELSCNFSSPLKLCSLALEAVFFHSSCTITLPVSCEP